MPAGTRTERVTTSACASAKSATGPAPAGKPSVARASTPAPAGKPPVAPARAAATGTTLVDDYPAFCRTSPMTALFLISVLGLFLELMLIRWIGTEVRIFAYLQNTVLVVCFLGLGMGCFSCRRAVSLGGVLTPLLVLLALMAVPFTRSGLSGTTELLSVLSDLVIWEEGMSAHPLQAIGKVALGLVLTYALMYLILSMFVPIGRILGRLMDDHPRTIRAYSVNVAGSLIGIWCFVALSAFYQPPLTWLVIIAGLMLPFLLTTRLGRQRKLGVLAAIVVLSWFAGQQPGALESLWSPYQKLVLFKPSEKAAYSGDYAISVNNSAYQAIIDLSDEKVDANPDRFPSKLKGFSQYDLPGRLHESPRRVLIVGAGAGNDAAGALRNGAEHVVAVEIDPAIIALGRRHHPENPYSDRRVKVVNDDARSYFATSRERFDVISFGLLDSHTMTAMTNARLDHYVYTRESLQQARSLLADGGILTLSFAAQRPFIADRMAGALREVFGRKPLVFRVPVTTYGWGGTMFVAGDLEGVESRLGRSSELSEMIAHWQKVEPVELNYATATATDDWPYIYLEGRRIPMLFFLLAGLLAILLVHGQKKLNVPRLVDCWSRSHWHFFFLGAAFLLLEVQNISKASVVLGNTWQVNAVIISGILAMILLANLIAARWPKLPPEPVYLALCLTCLGLYYVDLSRFAFLPYATKAVVLGGLTALPMLFSGIIFIRSFAGTANKHEALGANLIGALVGGLLQSITFVTGLKALLLVVAALYTAAMLSRGEREAKRVPAAAMGR